MAVNAQTYFAANPDVAASFASNNYGMTADEFANYHFANYGASESRTPVAGVTNEQIIGFLKDNPDLTDEQIVSSMKTYGISPSQMAGAVGLNEGEIASRVAATIPQGQTITLGDTIVQPVYQVTGSGETQEIGGLENVLTYKVGENQVGGGYNQYNPDGSLARTGTQQKVNNLAGEALLGSALLFGGLGGGFEGLFGGPSVGNGAFLGEGVASGIPLSDAAFLNAGGVFNPAFALGADGLVGSLTNLTGGSGTGALTGGAATTLGGGATTTLGGGSSTLSGLTGGSSLSGLTAGSSLSGLTTAGGLAGANTLLGGSTLGSTLGGLTTGVVGSTLGSTLGSTVGSTLGSTLANTATTGLGGLTAAQLGALLSGGLTTGAGLLQQQTSREAAQRAQQMIDTETAAAKQAAQFRPVGMTTRFGTSQFQVDPVTGQLTSAGYTLSPEAKNAQDRLVKLAEQGLVQAEGAQAQFAPLQTGAQNLFSLGNQYLAQSPQDVAQNYLNQQMALLQPGRELELANLQNRLQQQGRGGLAVAQGGTMGATTPELQALYNARAQQEAQLAANAQQYGQQNVLFGAGLLGQGATAMGNYYGGQQAAYAPYTTALGQVQGLETAAQQPLMLGANLGQTAAQAGFNVGQLGLRGAGASVELATGKAATNNPYASAISGLAANPAFGQYVGGLLSPTAPVTAMSAPATTFGTGNYYGQQDLGLFL